MAFRALLRARGHCDHGDGRERETADLIKIISEHTSTPTERLAFEAREKARLDDARRAEARLADARRAEALHHDVRLAEARLAEARRAEEAHRIAMARHRAEADARHRAEADARHRAEEAHRIAMARHRAEADARHRAEADARHHAEAEARHRLALAVEAHCRGHSVLNVNVVVMDHGVPIVALTDISFIDMLAILDENEPFVNACCKMFDPSRVSFRKMCEHLMASSMPNKIVHIHGHISIRFY
jgi:hypothetical protein